MSVRTCRRRILNNHHHGLFWALVGLLLFARIVPALAASPESMPVVPLTAEERAWLKAHPDITFGFTDAFEPAVIVNKDGSYSGTLVDFLDLLNQRLGTDFKIIVGPIPEVFSQVSRKELAGVLSLHPDNADKRGYLKTRDYMTSYPTIFTRKGVAFTGMDDLAGEKIAIIDNVFFSQNLVDRYGDESTIIKVKGALEGLERVKDGTADLFIGSSRNSYLLTKYQFFDIAATFQFYDYPTPNVMAVRSDWPQLVSILNKGLGAISDAEIESIKRKWISVPEQNKTIELTREEQIWLKANPTIKVGIFTLPPYAFVENGRNQGYLVDLMQLLAGQAGFTPDFFIQALPETFAKVKSGQLHAVLGIMRNDERAGFMYFSKNVLKLEMGIFAQASRSDIRDAASLKNKIIATRTGYGFERVVKKYLPDAKIIRADDAEGMMRLVASGEADATIRELHSGEYILHNSFMNNVNFKGFFTPPGLPETTGAEFAVSKKFPLLNSIFNKAYNAIPESEKTRVWRKWFARVESQEKTIELTEEEQAWIDQNHVVRVRMTDWPPYLIVKENKPPQGIAIEYLNLIEDRTGITFAYEVTDQPFAQFLESMQHHQGPDMAALMVQTPEREQYLSFTVPYVSSPYVIFTREQDDLFLDINGLTGKTLAVPRGFVIQAQLTMDYPDIRQVLFDSDEQALQAVATGQVDAYIGNLTVASHIIHQYGLSDLRVVAPSPFGVQSLSIGNRKDWPELTAIINKALMSITEAEKTAIRSQYVALRYEQGIDRADVVRWILFVGGGALGIVIIFIFWNRSLGTKVNQRTAALQQEVKIRKQTEQELEAYQERLKALASQLTLAEEKERQRIAVELHDQVGQSLAFARMRLATAKKNSGNEKLDSILDDVSVSMLQAVQDTRHVIFDLSSPAMREIGLRAAIAEWLEEEVQHRHGIQTAFIDKVDPKHKIVLPLDIRALMFRNVRELITNAVKHAQANQITVYAENTSDDLMIVVEDDGVGFKADTISKMIKKQGSFGFLSIKERMTDLGGALEIISEPGKGCQAILRMPLTLGEE